MLGATGSCWEPLGSIWAVGCWMPRAKTSLLQREGDALSPVARALWCCESPAWLWQPAPAPGCLQLDPASSSASSGGTARPSWSVPKTPEQPPCSPTARSHHISENPTRFPDIFSAFIHLSCVHTCAPFLEGLPCHEYEEGALNGGLCNSFPSWGVCF